MLVISQSFNSLLWFHPWLDQTSVTVAFYCWNIVKNVQVYCIQSTLFQSVVLLGRCIQPIFHSIADFVAENLPKNSNSLPNTYSICSDLFFCYHFFCFSGAFLTILSLITILHRECSSSVYLQSHFMRKLWFCFLIFFYLQPPCYLLRVTTFHWAKGNPFLSLFHCHRKFLLKVSIRSLPYFWSDGKQRCHVGWESIQYAS